MQLYDLKTILNNLLNDKQKSRHLTTFHSLIYSALTAIPATPVQSVSDTTEIRGFAFKRFDDFFIGISPVDVFKLINLSTNANRSKINATGIDNGAAVTLASAQYTNYLTVISI